jgi:hypothetical protein
MEKQINGGYQMVSSRLRTTIVFFALCGLMAGSAFAGVLASNPVTFAHEIAIPTANLVFAPQVYTMGIARNAGQNFILRFTLSNATFGSTVNPTGANLVYGGLATGVQIVQRSGGAGTNVVEYDINLTGAGAAGATVVGETFTFHGTINFAAGAAVGATTTITADARDVISALDTVPGPYTRTLATLAGAAYLTGVTQPRATIDATVTPPLTAFIAQGATIALGAANDNDTLTVAKALVTTALGTAGVKATDGVTDYTLLAGDQVTFTINGDFTNIASVGIDLNNDGSIAAAGGATPTTTSETFTINASLTQATLTVDGNRLPAIPGAARSVWFTKTAGSLNPRTFTISAGVIPVAPSQARSIGASASDWFVWVQNGTTIIAPYVSFTPGNGVKFRFVNSASTVVNVLVSVVLDQGTFTQAVTTFAIPANGSQQITFSDIPAAGTGELGPIASALLSGTAPVRGKVTFTVLSASSNVAGVELIYSPVGVVSIVNLPQLPSW